MRKLVNFTWFLSFFGFFASLLISYAYLPERVGIHADSEGIADTFLTKENFFYIALAAFAVCNIIFFVLIRLMEAVPPSSALYFGNESFKDNILGWLGGLATVVNLFLTFGVAYVAIFNNQKSDDLMPFRSLVYVAPMLALLSLGWLVFIFLNRHRQAVEAE